MDKFVQKANWEKFLRNFEEAGPLGFSHGSDDFNAVRDVCFHNVHIIYAYVLALAAHRKNSVSVLDWGGWFGVLLHFGQSGFAFGGA